MVILDPSPPIYTKKEAKFNEDFYKNICQLRNDPDQVKSGNDQNLEECMKASKKAEIPKSGRELHKRKMSKARQGKELTLIIMTFFLLNSAQGQSSNILPVSQICRSEIEEPGQCPQFPAHYDRLNKLCCKDNTVLHCLSKNNVFTIFCNLDIEVPAGFSLNMDGQNYSSCSEGLYEPNARMASQIRHPYCQKTKTKCSNSSGKQKLCDGGKTNDDLCICNSRHKPQSEKPPCNTGFGLNDACYCIPDPCPVGTYRNFTDQISSNNICSNKAAGVNYTCVVNVDNGARTAHGLGNSGHDNKSVNWITTVLIVLFLYSFIFF